VQFRIDPQSGALTLMGDPSKSACRCASSSSCREASVAENRAQAFPADDPPFPARAVESLPGIRAGRRPKPIACSRGASAQGRRHRHRDRPGRKRTDRADHGAPAGCLEIIPRRKMEYRGIVVEEMDVDAILERHPRSWWSMSWRHTNVPGSRNGKRYQDVQDLLRRGFTSSPPSNPAPGELVQHG